jgi:hypothetical protein
MVRRIVLGSSAWLVVAVLEAGCGGGGQTSATGGSGTTTSSSKATSASTSSSMLSCAKTTEIMPGAFQRSDYDPTSVPQHARFLFDPGVILGGSAPDRGTIDFWSLTLSGTQDLGSATSADYGSCTTCLVVSVDMDSKGGAAKRFFQAGGTVDLGASRLPAIAGKVTDATLVEVTIDETAGTATRIPGGECLHISSATFAFEPAPIGWTCELGKYADKLACDCDACGVPDPDCAIMPPLPVRGCGPGQACATDAKTCEGTVQGWTCAQSKYNENHGAPMPAGTCDCDCGIPDPDCVDPMAVLVGCTNSAPACNVHGHCVPAAWTCGPNFYGDAGTSTGGCDCGCGVQDIDCPDLDKTACDYCDDLGSCDTSTCSDPVSTIDPTNNAVCM